MTFTHLITLAAILIVYNFWRGFRDASRRDRYWRRAELILLRCDDTEWNGVVSRLRAQGLKPGTNAETRCKAALALRD